MKEPKVIFLKCATHYLMWLPKIKIFFL